jgi:hypothetical protein
MPNMGKIATVKNTIPKPPNHCVRLRQRSNAWGWLSILSRIDAPVVVNPDIDSKKASVKLGICPPSQYGRLPKRAKATQQAVIVI